MRPYRPAYSATSASTFAGTGNREYFSSASAMSLDAAPVAHAFQMESGVMR
jgi:hypothetical protein